MNVIAVDAMGGELAPKPEVAGAISATKDAQLKVVLCGDRERIEQELSEHQAWDREAIAIEPASQVVQMADSPSQVFRKKPDSSMRVAMELCANGKAAGFVSAGNSGAILAHSLFVLKRLPHVDRPGFVAALPTASGRPLVVCDLGANVDVKPRMLAQFGVLGAHYDRFIHADRARPRVAILSNGTEPSKGTELTRAAFELLKEAAAHPDAELEFVGYIEGAAIPRGEVDVLATDGFTGNIVLKLAEGLSTAMLELVRGQLESSLRSRLGAKLVKPELAALMDRIHPSEFGGALLLGVCQVVMICHGMTDATAVANAIREADQFASTGLLDSLSRAAVRHQNLWDMP